MIPEPEISLEVAKRAAAFFIFSWIRSDPGSQGIDRLNKENPGKHIIS